MTANLVILLDVDNTLVDGDRIVSDLHSQTDSAFGVAGAQRYWAIFDAMRKELGYVDYLGALQRYRPELEPGSEAEQQLLTMSSYLINYPFAERLMPRALDAIAHLGRFGTTVLLTDGDVVLQPRKLQRSGLWDAVNGRAMVCVHKEKVLDAVQRRYPARHYVMVDDKRHILSAMKLIWHERLSTIFVRQGHYALNPTVAASEPAADFTIERIGELAELDLASLIKRPADGTPATLEAP